MIFNESLKVYVENEGIVLGADYKWVVTFETEKEEGIAFVKEDDTVVIPLKRVGDTISFNTMSWNDFKSEDGIQYMCYNSKGYNVAYLADTGCDIKLKTFELRISHDTKIYGDKDNMIAHYELSEGVDIYETNNAIVQVNKCKSDIMDFVLWKNLKKVPSEACVVYKKYIPSYKAKGLAKCSQPFDFLTM